MNLNIPFLLAALLIQYPLMLVFPLLVGWWLRRRYRVTWALFGVGALTFVLSQVIHIPFNMLMGLTSATRGLGQLPMPWLALALGLSAGLFEEGLRWLVLTVFYKRARCWRDALQYGAGHEAAESIVFGLLALVALVNMLILRTTDLQAAGLSPALADRTRAVLIAYWSSPWYLPLLAGIERVATLSAQVAFAVLVMRSVTRRQPLYLLAAIAAHALVDTWAVIGMRQFGAIGVEVGLLVLAAAALASIFWLREPHSAVLEAGAASAPAPLSAADLAPSLLSGAELARRADASRFE